jgi:acetyltransferase-like isoleucine patch superfamily enzyme
MKYTAKIKNIKHGKNFKVIHPVNIYGSEFGDNIIIGPFTEIQKNVKINDNCKIQSHTFICEKVTIGKNCFIGHGVMFTNDLFKSGKLGGNKKKWFKTKILNNVLIGSNSTILPIKISSVCVIGAGSVVTKDCKIKGVYMGNPAKLVRRL